ncbi:hypothetical protein RDV89_03750 [Nocardioides zeae]|uniref:Uncharacterized protein n=1 Tax=Nocardioides imazamoxiresistens TaxID=3231893 RepID=A0ABU3PSE2_9ACTN|nr:hypothetical protein [Nocardioides zeae]MDT9592164.1 hypothetical protein [Nocardioides zeae]
MVARDRTARARIRQFLATSGPLDDSSGHATSALKEAIDYQGSSVAFIQLIAAMDRDGEIEREIRGKRTYRITGVGSPLTHAAAPAPSGIVTVAGATPATLTIDYDLLARALVRELLAQVAAPAAPVETDAQTAAERAEYMRRLADAREKIDALLSGEIDGEVAAPEGTIVSSR